MPEADPRRDVIVAIDQGTSSTKAIALGPDGTILGQASVPVGIQHPRPGWVQQDAEEIAASTVEAVRLASEGCPERVAAIGLSNQRESALVWDLETKRPLGPMLGWQDRRTTRAALALREHSSRVRQLTGLPIDPMFSALKFAWLLDQVDPDRSRSAAGEIVCGTVDSWLLYHHTGDVRIEAGNASRTALLDLASRDWSDELCALFRVPRASLPPVVASNEPSSPVLSWGFKDVRITGVLGDSHAALYGHGVRSPGAVKVTLGTGSSIMGLLPSLADAPAGLVTTLAWATPTPTYAFEGNILASGATLVWLAGILGTTPAELIDLATAAPHPTTDHGVDLVPAFAGLGAPWWDEDAKAVMTGFTLGTTRADIAVAGVESMALQIEDVLSAAERGSGRPLDTVLVDGGPAENDALVQLLADLTQRRVLRPEATALSAVGAAHLAGATAGVSGDAEARGSDAAGTEFSPVLSPAAATARRHRWHQAVAVARLSPSTDQQSKES